MTIAVGAGWVRWVTVSSVDRVPSVDQPAPSYDELAVLVVAQAAQIAELRAALEKAHAEIEALRAQVKTNSRNSSLSRDPDNEDFDAHWDYHLAQEQHRNHHSKFAETYTPT